jgi:ligand-binding SRPBCC domain-containing protein
MIVNVCPSGVAAVPAERVWQVLTTPARFGEWLQDASVVSIRPAGPATPGQRVELMTRAYGVMWRVRIDVEAIDTARRWIDLTAHLPFGLVNQERVTLEELDGERTQVRFN